MIDRARLLELLCAGERLTGEHEAEILGCGGEVASMLVEVLVDEELSAEGSRGDGYAPIHAARLLGELRSEIAIDPMLQVLRETDWNDIINNTVLFAMPRMGAAIVEPTLRAYQQSRDQDFRVRCAAVLSECGARDERIFDLLIATLAIDPDNGAGCLLRYGDERAIEHLSRAFDAFRLDRSRSALTNQTLIELREAIQELGGALTPEQEAKYTIAMEPRDRWRAQINSHVSERDERPGRNDPCWCGSAKKYKKCHLDADDETARLQRQP
jgi:hypothetical protein